MHIKPYTADDGLFEASRLDGQTRLQVRHPDVPQVVLGRGSKPESELHLEPCLTDGVPILRRRGGGCAVVLDPGDLIVSVSQRAPGLGHNQRHFLRLSTWLIAILEHAGVCGLQQAGFSDLVRDDRKVAGACLYRARDTLLYSASLLVDPAVALMERYLKHPPREPAYRRGRPHADFVGRLSGDPGALAEVLLLASPPGDTEESTGSCMK